MVRRSSLVILSFCLLGCFLLGCPKRVAKIPPVEVPPTKDPLAKLLEAFSPAQTLQAKASIRIDTKRRGEEMNFLLNGIILYQKPDKLRILGYHPLGMGLFDALYLEGEFSLLVPLQKRVYTGRVSEFGDLIDKAGEIRISTERGEGGETPSRIRVELTEKETSLELRLKNIVVNSDLPEGSFEWAIPEGVEVRSLAQFLRGRRR